MHAPLPYRRSLWLPLACCVLLPPANPLRAAENHGVPTAPSLVSVKPNDRRLFVRERLPDGTSGAEYAYAIRGVNWSPASASSDPVGDPSGFRNGFFQWYPTDIPLMAAMGVNTVRVYHDFGTSPQALEILDHFFKHGIKVIVQVDSPLHGVVADTANIPLVVNAYKNHPAILMWTIGNEWDIRMPNGKFYWVFDTLPAAAAWVQSAAQAIRAIDSNHAIATMIGDPHQPALHVLSQAAFPFLYGYPSTEDLLGLCSAVEVWGVQIYRNRSFMDLFQQWRSISSKPMFIAEFGADSYDHRINGQNPADQAAMNTGLWDEAFFDLAAERTAGATLGAMAFEFQDEWWKSGAPGTHNISIEPNGGQPDGVNDEEHFGLFTIGREPKDAATALGGRFRGGVAAVATNPNPVLSVTSQGPGSAAIMKIGDKTVFERGGGASGARGVNVFVLDTDTGIRIKDYRSFDTWATTPYNNNGTFANHRALTDYLNSLPAGAVIALAIADEGGFVMDTPTITPWPNSRVEEAYQTLENLGSTRIRQVPYRGGWAMITRKGGGMIAEGHSAAGETVPITSPVQLAPNAMAGVRGGGYLTPLPFAVQQVTRTSADAEIAFESVDGLVYQIEFSNDLAIWSLTRRGLIAEGARTRWVDNGAFTGSAPGTAPRRFYRARAIGQVFRPET